MFLRAKALLRVNNVYSSGMFRTVNPGDNNIKYKEYNIPGSRRWRPHQDNKV